MTEVSQQQTVQNTNDTVAAPATEPAPAPAATTEAAPQATPTVDSPATPQTPEAQEGLVTDAPAQDDAPTNDPEPDSTVGGILGAPEEGYAFDGFNMDDKGIGAFSETAKELNLSQESAQKLLGKTVDGLRAQMLEQRAELRQKALNDTTLDFANPKVAKQANDAFTRYFGGKPGLMAKIKAVNLDVDPEFLGALKAIGADMSEGTFVRGQTGPQNDPTDMRALFPNTKMNR